MKGFGQDPTFLEAPKILPFEVVDEIASRALDQLQPTDSAQRTELTRQRQDLANAHSVVQQSGQQLLAAQQEFAAAKLRYDLFVASAPADVAALFVKTGD
jgi:hypothetical protein